MMNIEVTHCEHPLVPALLSTEQVVLRQLLQHYEQNLGSCSGPLLTSYGISSDTAEDLNLGYCSRGLQALLPFGDDAAESIRGTLQRLGVVLPSGHERFRESLVIPDIDETGFCHQIAALPLSQRGVTQDLDYVSLSDPRFFNEGVLSHADSVILCADPLDSLILRSAGLTNVIALAGLRAFELDHLYALEAYGVNAVCFAVGQHQHYDAVLIAQALESIDIDCSCMAIDTNIRVSVNRYGHDYLRVAYQQAGSFSANVMVSGWRNVE